MAALLALVATLLTSFLPILNKRLLRDAPPALVAWIINAASLPILALGTLLLTQCSLSSLPGRSMLSCTVQVPRMDALFVAALLVSAVLNWAGTLLSTHALAKTDASLVSPLLTFNPAFTLLIAWGMLGETPGLRQTVGVVVVLFGSYLLEVEEARTGWLSPIRILLRQPGTMLALVASALWGTTTVLEKLAIEHMTPPSGPAVALLGTFLLVLGLSPGAWRKVEKKSAGGETKGFVDSLHIPVRWVQLSCLRGSLRSLGLQQSLWVWSDMSPPFSSSALFSPSCGRACSWVKANSGTGSWVQASWSWEACWFWCNAGKSQPKSTN